MYMYNKAIIRFSFCDMQDKWGLGKGYQPQPSTDNRYLDLDYSGYHKNLIQQLFIINEVTQHTDYISNAWKYRHSQVLAADFEESMYVHVHCTGGRGEYSIQKVLILKRTGALWVTSCNEILNKQEEWLRNWKS